jgi:glycine/D-amino acid oxidase-like deaminating enzyme
MAGRAIRMIPRLASARCIRSWAALRIMSADGLPIYDASPSAQAYVVNCHSGITLAAAHALVLAPAIASGTAGNFLAPFSARRFDVRLH